MIRHQIQKTRQKTVRRHENGPDGPDGTPGRDTGSEARKRARTASDNAARFLKKTGEDR